SIGGKTGVNHTGVKNLVGAFYQPALTVADVRTLATLPERELRSGLAEVIKTAVIGDAALFEFLEQHLPAVLRRDTAALVEVISRCAAFKARVVEVDERERSERRILNYGHTIGHAVEAAGGAGRCPGFSSSTALTSTCSVSGNPTSTAASRCRRSTRNWLSSPGGRTRRWSSTSPTARAPSLTVCTPPAKAATPW